MTCFLCGRNGSGDPLDRHHIFNGPYRKKSEKYGLVVYLCHSRCHINGKHAVHRDPETALWLKAWGQAQVMMRQGWDTGRFIREFGRDYIAKYEEEYENA